MISPIKRPWIASCLLCAISLLLTACPVPRIPPSLIQRAAPTQEGTTAGATIPAAMTPTPTPIALPTAGPTPTATPEPAAVADSTAAARLTEEGKARLQRSDLAGAEGVLIDAIAADSTHVPAYIALTELYLYWPQYWQQALDTAQHAAELAPEDPEVLVYLAWALQGAHRFDDALTTVQKALDLAPESALVHTAAADILSSVYQMDEAYEHAHRAVELDDQSANAWATLGAVAYGLEDWDEAGNAYEKAVALAPDFFVWHLLRARFELNTTGDIDVALALLGPARAAQPDHPWIISFDVDVAVERNQWATAEAGCEKLFVFNQPHTIYPDAFSCMAGVLILQERYADAERFQALAEAIAPEARLDISLLRMRLYNEQDNCAASRALAESWLDLRAYSVLSKRMIGVSYLCEENFAQAIAYFKQAYAALPRSVADARLLANAYARDGQATQAIGVLDELRSFAASDPLYYQALYEVYLYLGNTAEAISTAQQWQVLRPNSTDARESLALVQLIDGNTDAAQRAAKEAIDAGSVSSTVYSVYGETLRRQGQDKEAEAYLLQALAREPDHFLAHSFITSLYLAQGDCEKVEPHLDWLANHTKDQEEADRYRQLFEDCAKRTPDFRPDPATALDDFDVLDEVLAQLAAAGVEARTVRFADEENQRSLVVTYDSALRAGSQAFADQENQVPLTLAKLLPRIESQPVGMIVLSGSQDEPQNFIYVATRAAFLWVTGELTDEEFIDTWYVESADNFTGK